MTRATNGLTEQSFFILLALAEGPRHGYAIMGDVEELSKGRVSLSTGTLYGAIKRMMRDGLVERSDIRPDPEMDDERRRYYRITEFGREVAACEVQRINRLAEMVRNTQFARRTP